MSNDNKQVSSLDEGKIKIQAINYARERYGWTAAEIEIACMEGFKAGAQSDAAKEYWFSQWQSQQTNDIEKLKYELKVTNDLLDERQRVLDAIPPCRTHGKCIPHALEWIEKAKESQQKETKPTGLRWVNCADKDPDSNPYTIIRTTKHKMLIMHDWYFAALKNNTIVTNLYEWLDESGETEETKPVEDKKITLEKLEEIRLYAESRMIEDWDRTDANTVGVFYNYYIEKLIQEFTSQNPTQKPIEDKHFICPLCGGDGKETCSNPDHGFINGVGGETQRLGCPVCGHDENHKVPNGGKCDVCNGTGIVSEMEAENFCKEYHYDNELIETPKPVSEEGWISEKPFFDKDRILLTASKIKDTWDYQSWIICSSRRWGDNSSYMAWCNLEGEEYGDIADLKADRYKVIEPVEDKP